MEVESAYTRDGEEGNHQVIGYKCGYPIADNKQVSLVKCVPNKDGIIVFSKIKNDLIPTRPITIWRICIDYQKLNGWTKKTMFDTFHGSYIRPFSGQMMVFFCDGYLSYNQISIAT